MRDISAVRFSVSLLVVLAGWAPMAWSDEQAGAKAKTEAKQAVSSGLFASSVRPFLTTHCTSCHGKSKPKAGLNLAALEDESKALANRRVWTKVKENVEGSLMPPEGRPQPSREEMDAVSKWIGAALLQVDCGRNIDPGRVTIRRLNRAEYNNTIRDLLGVDFHPADDFPSDDVGYGFDNIGDVLTIPPILMEKYLAAAESISEHAIMTGTSSLGPIRKWEAQRSGELSGGTQDGDAQILSSRGEISIAYTAARNGSFVVRVMAFGQQAGPEPARMALLIDGKTRQQFDVTAVEESPGTYEVKTPLGKGSHRIAAAFLNDYFNPDDPDPSRRDRNLAVQCIEVEGPLYVPGDPLPESHRRIIFRSPTKPAEYQECARPSCEDSSPELIVGPSAAASWPSSCGLSIWLARTAIASSGASSLRFRPRSSRPSFFFGSS